MAGTSTMWRRLFGRRARKAAGPKAGAIDLVEVERAARYLVQKIARLHAASHALSVWRSSPAAEEVIDGRLSARARLERDVLARRVVEAERLHAFAVEDLRLELGLPEQPTQAECSHWGEAP